LQLQSYEDIYSEIQFYFSDESLFSNVLIKNQGEKYLIIRIKNFELKQSKEFLLVKITEYLTNKSQDIINIKLNQDKLVLSRRINSLESEIKRLSTLNEDFSDSKDARDFFVSEMNVDLAEAKLSIEALENILNDSDLFQNTKVYNEITTKEIKPKSSSIIFLKTLFGFLFSILVVIIRQTLNSNKKILL